VLKTQLRAFLRVSARHPVSILIPVVIGVEDILQVREVVRQVQASSRRKESASIQPSRSAR